MKIITKILNVITAIYFFIAANIFFWFSVLAVSAVLGKTQTTHLPDGSVQVTSVQPSGLVIVNMLLAPFLIWGTVMFFRKTKSKYNYGLILLSIVTIIYVFWQSLTEKRLDITVVDLQNALFFLVPMLVIYVAKRLEDKVQPNVAVR